MVRTGIGTSDRNAPASLRGGDRSPDVELVEQALADSTTQDGMAPDEVAALAVDAVRTGRFFIGTKPSFAAQVQQRTEALLAGHLPAMPAID